jgi:hypothetical protein
MASARPLDQVTAEPFGKTPRRLIALELGLVWLARGKDLVVSAIDDAKEESAPPKGKPVEFLDFETWPHKSPDQ